MIPDADLDTIIHEQTGREGKCNRCGLCCLIAQDVHRVPKDPAADPALANGVPDGVAKGGPDLRLYWERQGYAVGLETIAYWFMMRWDPCKRFRMFTKYQTPVDIPALDLNGYVVMEKHGLIIFWSAIDSLLNKYPIKVCTRFGTRPLSCRAWPNENPLCMWLITKEHGCGYTFPHIDKTRQKMEE